MKYNRTVRLVKNSTQWENKRNIRSTIVHSGFLSPFFGGNFWALLTRYGDVRGRPIGRENWLISISCTHNSLHSK